MTGAQWLFRRLTDWGDAPALVDQAGSWSYGDLVTSTEEWKVRLGQLGFGPGAVVAFQSDYSRASISLLLACIDLSQIAVPLALGLRDEVPDLLRICEARILIRIDAAGAREFETGTHTATNPLTRQLADSGDAGVVIFSSGSTGTPKATLHNLARFLAKFQRERPPSTTIAVPPMDHVAGLDTLFYCLSSGGRLVCPDSRDPEAICQAIDRHRIELLPASAAFLNLLLASRAMDRYDLSSLRTIAYGSDVMPEATLLRLRERLPPVTFLQKYGTTEFGSPSTRSRQDGSLWLKIDDKSFETKIVDGILWIKSHSAMLGYLNAPSPFEEDGWINTGDAVEESEGGYVRILGRKSDVINVGGHKVFPAEVEAVLLQLSNIEDVVVYGKPNLLLGKVVAARFRLERPEDIASLKRRVRAFCGSHLAAYKIPVEIDTADGDLMTARQKKVRQERPQVING
jgi:long-chain acyl-CoA synthetase